MTGGTVRRQACVPPVERITGLAQMIESADVERPELRLPPHVLDVTRHTVGGHVPMHAAASGDAARHRFVAAEAPGGRHTLPRLMAVLAFPDAFLIGMEPGERAR